MAFKKVVLYFCIFSLLCFFNSCAVDNVDISTTEAETTNVDISTTEAETTNIDLTTEEVVEETVLPEETEKVIDKEKYPISEGLKSADEIVKCGLFIDGVYYEGFEVVYSGLYCSKTSQTSIGENSMYVLLLKDQVPDGCPVISADMNDRPEFLLKDNDRSIRGVTYYSMDNPYKASDDYPSAPGLYWAIVRSSEIPMPWENENYVYQDELTEYVLAYQYIYLLMIE